MIEQRIELVSGATVAHLTGSLGDRNGATRVARDLIRGHQPGSALVVDMSDLDAADFEPLSWLVLQLEAWPGWRDVRLVDNRIEEARWLRAASRRLPVLPDVATALTLPVGAAGAGRVLV